MDASGGSVIALVLTACSPEPAEEKELTLDTSVGAPEVSLSAEALAFGEVEVGTSTAATLQLVNVGDATATVSGVSSTSDEVAVDLAAGTLLVPGQTLDVTATWSPTQVGELDASTEVLIQAAGLVPLTFDLTGTAAGPVLSFSVDEVAFDTVSVGCSATATVTVANSGTRDLVLSDMALVEQDGLSVATADGSSLPWTIAAGSSLDFVVTWTPEEEANFAGTIEFATNDPSAPTASLPVSGIGHVEGAGSVTYTVAQQNVTVLFALNAVITSGSFAERLTDALPYFFEGLQAADVHYRAAFLVTTDGEVAGDVAYIDETYTPGEAVDIAEEMIDDAAGDNDYLLQTLEQGIEAQRDWLLDDDDDWLESQLNLVGLNTDQEQSSGDAMSYITKYRAYKEEEDDVVVHGVGGPIPAGCAGADPFTQFYEATQITGGQFFSVCDEDWTENFVTLGEAALGGNLSFALEGTPQEDSIQLFEDDVEVTEGWEYDEDLNAIRFSDEAYPDDGTELRIDYNLAVECTE